MRAADFLIGKPGPGSIAEAMVRKLPVLIECNAWTLPQERYNTVWVQEQQVGIVLSSFKNVVAGVNQMLNPTTLSEFQHNVAAQNNQAVFEIPEILAKLLGEPSRNSARPINSQQTDPVAAAR
jgi:UDP-N-acetylglucosamine:LPS N-acetylglucosamine transferase